MFACLTSVIAVIKCSQFPTGTFYGQVRPLLFPAQEITVSTRGDRKGTIVLRGAVNADDIFWYDNASGEWNIHLGDRIEKTMQRVHAEFVTFDFDEKTDRGVATVRLPIVGNICVTLSRVNDREETPRPHKYLL